MILLDTNVLSELMKAEPQQNVTGWFSTLASDEIYTSSVVMAELLSGAERMPAGRRQRDLLLRVESILAVFDKRILAFDEKCARVYAAVIGRWSKFGKPPSAFDGLIAATAIAHEYKIATRNVKHFTFDEIDLINPWEFNP